MSDTKYTVTFRMARRGHVYDNPRDDKPAKDSVAGHLWYVLRKNGIVTLSAGFQSRNEEINGNGKITNDDEESYRNSPASITIQLNKQQYNTLFNFGNSDGANARAKGFEPSDYKGLWHNCVIKQLTY